MSTINGRACVVNGVPVDKVFSNGKQVYGRNLLLDTNFNNLPQYWTARAGTVAGTFNGHNVIYYDAKTITGDFTNVLQQPIYNPALTTNRVIPSQWYTLSFYTKGSGEIKSYVYPNLIDTTFEATRDGVKGPSGSDGYSKWNLNSTWTKHIFTFKTKSVLPTTNADQNVLWQLFKGNEAYICMPKLEAGTLATPWTPAPEDVM